MANGVRSCLATYHGCPRIFLSPDFPAYNARMASLYREVVLKEKPVQSQDGFIPLGALAKPNGNGNGAQAAKTEIAEPVAGD